ncbi:MAG: VWA domain-containing protein, partial [Desulfobacteraceae bacterium]|nr:VWA domain-containing protein [Desulfobacteraceae bacterium]
RFYIKQYEEETNLKAYLLLDCSASMAYRSGSRVMKLDYARLLAAALSYMMLRQRDAVGLVAFDERIRRYVPPRSKYGHLHVLLSEIAGQSASHTTDVASALHEMAERIKRRGLVIVLSDLLDEAGQIISGLKHFRYNKHEVIVFHILDPRERDFAFPREAIFKDMETGEELTTLPYQIKKDYAQAVRGFADEIAAACRQANIDYHPIDTATPFDKALYAFLAKRERLY